MKLEILHHIRSVEHGRELYRALAQELHPDRGGNPGLFQQLQDEWSFVRSVEEFHPGYWADRFRESATPPVPVEQPAPRRREIPEPVLHALEKAGAHLVNRLSERVEETVAEGLLKVRDWWEKDEYD